MKDYIILPSIPVFFPLQNALNAQRVAGLIKTAETMGILDTSTESTKQSDIDEILGFLAALEKFMTGQYLLVTKGQSLFVYFLERSSSNYILLFLNFRYQKTLQNT